MNMDKLPLAEANDQQIRAFARDILQLDGADSKEIKKVRADVVGMWPQDFIWIARAPEPIQVSQPTGAAPISKSEIEERAGPGIAASSSKNDPTYTIIINKSEAPGGKDPVYLNVNGMAIHIARGIEQIVPYRYIHDLKNAVQRIHDWNEKTGTVSSEDVHRFPFNVLKSPSDDEIFEFEALDAQRSGQVLTRDHWNTRRANAAERDQIERVRSERERSAA